MLPSVAVIVRVSESRKHRSSVEVEPRVVPCEKLLSVKVAVPIRFPVQVKMLLSETKAVGYIQLETI